MRNQRPLVVLGLAAVLLGSTLIGGRNPFATAQDADAPANLAADFGLGAGVGLEQLAEGVAERLPQATVVLRLERIILDPGSSTEVSGQTTGPELLYVETGEVTAVDTFGFAAPLFTGASALLQQGFGYGLTNAEDGPASILRLSLQTPAEASTVDGATPAAAPPVSLLFEGEISGLPPGPAVVFLGRMTLDPEAATERYAFNGPFGLAVISGSLASQSLSGLEAQLGRDRGILFPAEVIHQERNTGDGTAAAFVFGVVDAAEPLLTVGLPPAMGTPAA